MMSRSTNWNGETSFSEENVDLVCAMCWVLRREVRRQSRLNPVCTPTAMNKKKSATNLFGKRIDVAKTTHKKNWSNFWKTVKVSSQEHQRSKSPRKKVLHGAMRVAETHGRPNVAEHRGANGGSLFERKYRSWQNGAAGQNSDMNRSSC